DYSDSGSPQRVDLSKFTKGKEESNPKSEKPSEKGSQDSAEKKFALSAIDSKGQKLGADGDSLGPSLTGRGPGSLGVSGSPATVAAGPRPGKGGSNRSKGTPRPAEKTKESSEGASGGGESSGGSASGGSPLDALLAQLNGGGGPGEAPAEMQVVDFPALKK